MKTLIILALLFTTSFTVNAQSFFKPKPLPQVSFNLSSSDSSNPYIKNFIRPVFNVSAAVSNGTSLAGGFGVAFTHDNFDIPSNSWIIQYSVSALAFLTTNGNKISGTGGIVFGIPGTAGIIQTGIGYDFTFKQKVFLSGVGINF